MHKAEAGDMLGVVGSLLSAGTHLQKKTDLQLKNKFKKLHHGSWKQNWCKMHIVSLHCKLTSVLMARTNDFVGKVQSQTF